MSKKSGGGFGVVVVLLIVAIVVVYYFAFNGSSTSMKSLPNVTTQPTVMFAGRTVNVPEGWGVSQFGTNAAALSLTHPVENGPVPEIKFEDERRSPEIASMFVSGWQKSLRVPGFHPLDLREYHDAAVDAAGDKCVVMHWPGPRPLRIVCVSANGKWKLTLSGTDGDVAAFDAMAAQMTGFAR